MGHIEMSVVMAKRRGEGRASGKAISTDIESLPQFGIISSA